MSIQGQMDDSNDKLDTIQHLPFQSLSNSLQTVQAVIHDEMKEDMKEENDMRRDDSVEERVEDMKEERGEVNEEKEEEREERVEEKEERVEEKEVNEEEKVEEKGEVNEEKEEEQEEKEEREEEQEDKQQSIHSFTSQIQEEPTVEFSSGDGGLGNNILGLVSAYMIAALSNATFYCIIFLHSYSLHSTLSNYH